MRDTIKVQLRQLFSNSGGQSVVEYGLLLSLIVLVIVTAVTATPRSLGGAASQGRLGAIVSTAVPVPR